jgi:hypothetical protein
VGKVRLELLSALTYILHRAGEGIRALLERSVDVLFASNLVAHFHALVKEDLVGFLDLFFCVVGRHLGGV